MLKRNARAFKQRFSNDFSISIFFDLSISLSRAIITIYFGKDNFLQYILLIQKNPLGNKTWN